MNVTVMGSGAFGFAIAEMLKKNGNKVTIWTHNKEKNRELKSGKYEIIPGFKVSKDYIITSSVKEALDKADIVFIMVAAKFIGEVSLAMKEYINPNIHFCIGSKGIEQGTCDFTTEVFLKNIKTRNLSIISGPSFAIDMVNNEPIGLTIAGYSKKTKELVKIALSSDTVKLRNSSDVIGVQICGSIKNVVAVASGILSGLGYNESTRSFLITEAMHDIKELSDALGGKKKTILSYAGIGDLLLTCTSVKSRNYSYGILLGKKDYKGAAKYLEETTVEGYYTLKSIYSLLNKKKIHMPIIDIIYKIILEDADPEILAHFLINKK